MRGRGLSYATVRRRLRRGPPTNLVAGTRSPFFVCLICVRNRQYVRFGSVERPLFSMPGLFSTRPQNPIPAASTSFSGPSDRPWDPSKSKVFWTLPSPLGYIQFQEFSLRLQAFAGVDAVKKLNCRAIPRFLDVFPCRAQQTRLGNKTVH
jgi:hypothetical protein